MSKRSRRNRDDDTAAAVSVPKSYYSQVQRPQALIDDHVARARAALNVYERRAFGSASINAPVRLGADAAKIWRRDGIVQRYVPARLERPSGQTLSPARIAKSPVPVKANEAAKPRDAMAKRKPGEFVTNERKLQLRVDKVKTLCLSANRPTDTKGGGGSRPFVPWCEKGKVK